MSEPPLNHRPPTELDQQLSHLPKALWRLMDVGLNWIFDLNLKGTRRRRMMLLGIFLIILLLLGFLSHEISISMEHLRNIFLYLFDPTVAVSFETNPIQSFFQFFFNTYKHPVVIRYILAFTLPFLVAWQLAATYLADVFEKPVKIASTFIIEVALLGGRHKIRIYEGEMDRHSEDSPVAAIGGPGSVTVELDSAAIFERSDGRPHIIGPTIDGPAVLEGFERFRQAIDLRDHRTEILNITSRSLNGIPVGAINVNFLFSVLRKKRQSSAGDPYSFLNNNVIESLIYGQTARVSRGGPRPADVSSSWPVIMEGLIRKTLREFMSEHDLTEYLASFGTPERQSAHERVNAVIQIARRILPPEGPLPALTIDDVPPFIPRPQIKSSLFGNFAQAFPTLASQRGIELHWVGIGSWKTPSQIVPEQHLEAWKLSMENKETEQNIGSPELHSQYSIRFIEDIPLSRFVENLRKGKSHRDMMFSLLVGYREQFIKILSIMEKKRDNIDPRFLESILGALQHINQILGWTNDNSNDHWVQPSTFPSPSEETPPRYHPSGPQT